MMAKTPKIMLAVASRLFAGTVLKEGVKEGVASSALRGTECIVVGEGGGDCFEKTFGCRDCVRVYIMCSGRLITTCV